MSRTFRMQVKGWKRGLLTASLAVLGVGAFGPTGRADVIFNAAGTGPVATDELNVGTFTNEAGSALAVNGNLAVQNFRNGTGSTQFTLQYQSTVASISGTPVTPGTSVVINPDLPVFSTTNPASQPATGAGSGLALLSPAGGAFVPTKEFTIAGTLTEQVIGFNATTGTATFALVSGGTNTFNIYAQPGGSANESTGTGFTNATPILSGTVLPTSFLSSFTTGATPTTSVFDQYTQTGTPGYTSPYATTGPGGGPELTVNGGGTTQFRVQVNSDNAAYFVTPPPSLISVSLNPIAAVVPFQQTPPGQSVNGVPNGAGTLAGIGMINGGTIGSGGGNSIEFQTTSTLNFTSVPEPGPFVLTLAGIGVASLASLRRRFRRNGAPAA